MNVYQVQIEINICEEAMYADFVVWTIADIQEWCQNLTLNACTVTVE